jgi:hypothetical protein
MVSLKRIKFLCRTAKEYNFSFPQGFDTKTPQWLRRQYNGIGAEWMPSFLRKFITFLFRPLEPAALIHDVEFLSENKSFWKFTVANMRLAYNCIKARHFWSGISLGMICQLFGWSAWKEGKETMAWHYYFKEQEEK